MMEKGASRSDDETGGLPENQGPCPIRSTQVSCCGPTYLCPSCSWAVPLVVSQCHPCFHLDTSTMPLSYHSFPPESQLLERQGHPECRDRASVTLVCPPVK